MLVFKVKMEKEERIKKLQEEVRSLRDLLSRVEERTTPHPKTAKKEKTKERIDILKRVRERKIIGDDIPPF